MLTIDIRRFGTGKTIYKPGNDHKVFISTSSSLQASRASNYLKNVLGVEAWYIYNHTTLKNSIPNVTYVTMDFLFEKLHYKILIGQNPFGGFDSVILDDAHKTTEEYIGVQILINEKFKTINGMSKLNYSVTSSVPLPFSELLFSNFDKEIFPLPEKDALDLKFNNSLSLKSNMIDMTNAIKWLKIIIIREIEQWEKKKLLDKDSNSYKHGILVLLPSILHQNKVFKECQSLYESKSDIEINLIHSKIYDYPIFKESKFNIIISDSVASEGVNLPIHSVIISGIQEHQISDYSQQHIILPYIMSKNEIIQAQSRIGRPGQPQGNAYCLFSHKEWDTLEENGIIETTVSDITRLVLSLLIHKIDIRKYFVFMGSELRVLAFIKSLQRYKAIDNNLCLTKFGEMVRLLPFSVGITKHIFRFISNGEKSRASTIIIVLTFLQQYDHLFHPPEASKSMKEKDKESWKIIKLKLMMGSLLGVDEMETMINIWNAISNMKEEEIYAFAKEKLLNSKYLLQSKTKSLRILKRLELDGSITKESMPFDEFEILVKIEANIYKSKTGKTYVYLPTIVPKSFPYVIYPLSFKGIRTIDGIIINCIVACSVIYQDDTHNISRSLSSRFFGNIGTSCEDEKIDHLKPFIIASIGEKKLEKDKRVSSKTLNATLCTICYQPTKEAYFKLTCNHNVHCLCYTQFKKKNNNLFITCSICGKGNCRIEAAY